MGKCAAPFKGDSLYSFELYLCLSKSFKWNFWFSKLWVRPVCRGVVYSWSNVLFFLHTERCAYGILVMGDV